MNKIDEYLKNEQLNKELTGFKKRKKLMRFSRYLAGIIIVFAVVLFIYEMIIFVKKASVFSINNVIVKGNFILTAKDIFELGELSNNENIFKVDLQKLKNRLELHPLIKSVLVRRQLPDKLVIEIKERKGIALLNIERSRKVSHLYEIDKDGYVISEDNDIINMDMPIITGIGDEDVIPGEKISNTNVINILKILNQVNKEIYMFDRIIAEININKKYADTEYVMIIDKWNFPVYMGKNININKFFKLNALLMVLGDKLDKIEYIDFKYNDAVGKFKS